MRGTLSGELQFDPKIEKTARANRKVVRQAKQAARLATLEQPSQEGEEDTSSSYISEEEQIEMAEVNPPPPPPPRRTLGDYGQRNDG
ncbi:hypothetical protein A2U01_0050469, partial [Trifolium medium]|nr:hypothetical protein [Trifolium medium]